MTPLRGLAVAAFVLALWVGAVALAGWLAAHVPFPVALIGALALVYLMMTDRGGAR